MAVELSNGLIITAAILSVLVLIAGIVIAITLPLLIPPSAPPPTATIQFNNETNSVQLQKRRERGLKNHHIVLKATKGLNNEQEKLNTVGATIQGYATPTYAGVKLVAAYLCDLNPDTSSSAKQELIYLNPQCLGKKI
jgi:hypothetical protein